ncbi:hypothetical protein HAX54_023840 [Datura stramonium]|uniref:Uncharacterized protein n=1 Tax=Datura stramonium TaxID=4076 RepID=A0ABS8UZ56_DATST|nr:hypothetical protein [Datura stramonium]
MGVIIVNEINSRAMKLSTSLPFPCLIIRLCREAHLPIRARIDFETLATKKYDLEKSKDEIRYGLKLRKPVTEYALTPANFAKRVRKADIHEKQLKLFAEQLRTFVDRAITADLEPYVSLHACIDDMEAQINDRLKDLSMLDLAKFAAELKNV